MKWNNLFKKSIIAKLFTINLIMLMCIVVSQLIFQFFYFEKFYLKDKTELLHSKVKEFEKVLNTEKDELKILSFIEKVNEKDNIALSIRNDKLENMLQPIYIGKYSLDILSDSDNKEYRVILEGYPKNLNVSIGDKIKAIGVVNGYSYIFPTDYFGINDKLVNKIYEKIPSDKDGLEEPIRIPPILEEEYKMYGSKNIPFSLDTVDIVGRVTGINNEDNSYLPKNNVIDNIRKKDKKNLKEVLKKNEFSTTIYNDLNKESLVYTKHYKNYIIASSTPLAEVNEVLGTMNKYYGYLFLVALIVIIIVSIVYSKIITKPLIEMSLVAKDIASKKFNSKYSVKSNDEIGKLGTSLNLISENLEISLEELKKANVKLQEDMDNQKIEEEKRKELVANISHELKTPITIIQGYINSIKNGVYGSEKYDEILDETNNLNELVKEMLDMSKLESLSYKLNKEPFDLLGVFLKVNDKLRGLIKEKNLDVIFDLEDEYIVYGDEKRIYQVISNLYTNAIKYTQINGKINIDVSCDDKYYIFEIENFGIRLTEEEIENIWDAFYRGEKSRNKKYGGTGLGLSIVKKILELHGNEFGVVNGEDSVKFYFYIERYFEI